MTRKARDRFRACRDHALWCSTLADRSCDGSNGGRMRSAALPRAAAPSAPGGLDFPSAAYCFRGKSPVQHIVTLSGPAVKSKICFAHTSLTSREMQIARERNVAVWITPNRPQGFQLVSRCNLMFCFFLFPPVFFFDVNSGARRQKITRWLCTEREQKGSF